VGLIEMATFHSARIQLEPEDTLLLYSDGVTEAMDRNEDMFGAERLKEVLGAQRDLSLGALQAGILEAVEQFAEGASQSDDITLLVVRYRRPAHGAERHAEVHVAG
jgi:sigma-B regulation protein RsbU (phosphoserine phosphatase)